MGRIWAIASGSGGVGKTTLALSLALGAAQRGKSAILVDASGITRSADLLLGLESVMAINLTDALSQQMELSAALYPVPKCNGLRLASASFYENTGFSEFSGLMLALQSMCDVLVIDLKTGELPGTEGIMTHEDEIIFVSRPDDASMRSTERLLQQAHTSEAGLSLVINRVKRDKVRKGLQYTPDAVSMTLDCPLLGVIHEDDGYMADMASGKALRGFMPWSVSPVREILNNLLKAE